MKKVLKYMLAAAFLLVLVCSAAMAEAADITSQCKFLVTEGDVGDATDASIKTGWAPQSVDAELRIAFPAGTGYVAVDWLDDPTGYVFTQYDESLNPIAETTEKESFVGISQLFYVDSAARYAGLRLTQPGQAVQKVRVYSAGDLPLSVKDFQPKHQKCDLMVVSAHQDDEWIFFGGIIPYYEYVMEKDVQVVYMANCGRLRKAEALNGLWAGGVRNHPEFIDLVDENIRDINTALDHWGGKEGLTETMVEYVRRYKPEVILTHDIDGEYGHNQHKLTSRAMETVIQAAANPEMFPESAAKYGAWQVKKLYLHLAPNSIDFDWNVAYEQLRGYTPLEVARIAYSKHESQQEYYQVNDGGQYDNSLFGLTYSTVGEDIAKNDLFENIAEVNVPAATAEPVVTPEPMQEEAAPEEPVQPEVIVQEEAPDIPVKPVTAEEDGGNGLLIGVIVGVGVIVLGGGGYFLLRGSRYRRNKRRRRRLRR